MLEYYHEMYARLDGSSSDATVDCKDVTDLRWAGSFFRNGLVELTAEIAAPGFSVASLGFGYRHHSPFAGRHRRAPCVGHDSLSSVCPGDAASAIRDTIVDRLRELWQDKPHTQFGPEYGPSHDVVYVCRLYTDFVVGILMMVVGVALVIMLYTSAWFAGLPFIGVGLLYTIGMLFCRILPRSRALRGPGISIFHTLIADVTPAVTAILAQHGLAGRLVLSAESKMMNQGLCYGHQYVFIRLEVVKSQLGWTLATASALTDKISDERRHSEMLASSYGKRFINKTDMYALFTRLESIKKECEETDTKPQLGQQALNSITPQIVVAEPGNVNCTPLPMADPSVAVQMVAPVTPYVSLNSQPVLAIPATKNMTEFI